MDVVRRLMGSSPFKLMLTIFIAFYFHASIPYVFKQGFLSISLSIKELLVFMIPLIIFSSVYSAFAKIREKAFYLMLVLVLCVILSNFLSVSIAGLFSYFTILGCDIAVEKIQVSQGLSPLWVFTLPKFISNDLVLLSALVLAYVSHPGFSRGVAKIESVIGKIADLFLKKFFLPCLPLFVFGFVLKLLDSDVVGEILAVNARVFCLMLGLLLAYLILLYLLAVVFYKKNPKDLAKNLMDPAIAAFTSMSSAAALPFSIKSAAINTGDKNIADIVMPATTNIHMIGDSLCIPIMAMMMLTAFHMPVPTLGIYLFFAAKFTWTKFSGAGVPGGSILVMIPVLESTLGFTGEMTALITIFYMLVDPITTTGNVVGNNLFVIHFHKFYGFLGKKNKSLSL